MSLLPPARAPRRAVARVTRMAADNASPARLSYALIIILAFQTLLFTCLLASFAGFLLLTFFDLTGRVGEVERLAATLPTPAASSLVGQPSPTPTAADTLVSVEQPVSPLISDGATATATGDASTAAPTAAPTVTETATVSPSIATPSGLPTNDAPPQQPDAATPTPPALSDLRGVTLTVLQNSGQSELLELRNEGAEIVDISNWQLYGSLNLADVTCIIPGATSLPPGGVFQIASGDASLIVQGYICADIAIWDDNTEIIFLAAGNGQTIQVQANSIQPPTPIAETPSPTPTLAAPTPIAPNVSGVTVTVLQNSGQSELLELRNQSTETIDISGWRLYGSINAANITCTIPDGSSLPPGGGFQIASGNSSPTGQGYICATTTIWDDNAEKIFLAAKDGQTIPVEANPVQTPAAGATPTLGPEIDASPTPGTPNLHGITLAVVENSGQFELLELTNVATETVDISSWQLTGSINAQMTCIIPAGTSLAPDDVFQIASGETPLTGPGHTCANIPIWDDSAGDISLTASDGQSIQVQASPASP